MKNLYGITKEKLEQYFLSINEKKFKATQVFEWLYDKRVSSIDDFKNIKEETKKELKKEFILNKLSIISKQTSEGVIKYLFKLEDNNNVEAVLMKQNYGNSLCISTQVGCNMGCTFCESGRLKKVRNLETFEMILQILMIEEEMQIRISHIVLMGIGEPLDNFDNVMDFLSIAKDSKAIAIGARHITLSTCGIVPKIKEFMEHENQVNLAISLHAPNDIIRSKIMPINNTYKISDIIKVTKEYIKKTNRRVTFEYVMISNINDKEEHAVELSKLLRGINCYINLIPYNETSNIDYRKSSKESILKFYDILKQNKINVTIRREFGSEVMAACGQLRANYEGK